MLSDAKKDNKGSKNIHICLSDKKLCVVNLFNFMTMVYYPSNRNFGYAITPPLTPPPPPPQTQKRTIKVPNLKSD